MRCSAKPVEVTEWFKFDKADCYQVTGTYQFTLRDGGLRPLWDGFATARCLLHVTDKAAP